MVSVKPIRCLLVAALCVLLSACGEQSPPEQRIRTLIGDLEQAVEAGEKRGLDAFLHASYSDPWHKNRLAAVSTLIKLMLRHRSVHLFTLTETVELDSATEGRANAVVYVAMTGVPVESIDALISLKADLYRFDVGLIEEDGDWQILTSRWERVDPGAL